MSTLGMHALICSSYWQSLLLRQVVQVLGTSQVWRRWSVHARVRKDGSEDLLLWVLL